MFTHLTGPKNWFIFCTNSIDLSEITLHTWIPTNDNLKSRIIG